MRKLSFVIPCYGSERTIEKVVSDIFEAMNDKSFEYEIILANDNSPDRVWDKICGLVNSHNNIRGIALSRNFGQHSALMAGYGLATGDIIVSMDDDGQTPVESVFDMIAKLDEGYDVVFAKYEEIKQTAFRRFGSAVNEKMTEIFANKPKDIVPTSYFVVQKYIVDEMLRYKGAFPYIGGLIYRSTKRIANVEVQHRARLEGKSGYNLRKLIRMWLNGLTAFSVKPLRIASVMGGICAVFGLLYGLFIVIRKIMIPQIMMGYSSLMATILFVGGVIMLLLGMIGEYVGRIYLCINNEPQYIIKEIIGDDK